MRFGRASVDPAVLADRLVRAVSIGLAVVVVVLAAAVAFDWSPVTALPFDVIVDPAGDLPF